MDRTRMSIFYQCPVGLSGEGISLLARMGAICDLYDAVTSDRPYKARGAPPNLSSG